MADWNRRFYGMAHLVATWSKDWSTKVGCVAFDPKDGSFLALGYNGFPRKMLDDLPGREERALKNKLTVHAESNMIVSAGRRGVNLQGATIATTFFPCTACAGLIIQAGIREVVTAEPDWKHERWGEDFNLSYMMFHEVGTKMVFLEETTNV